VCKQLLTHGYAVTNTAEPSTKTRRKKQLTRFGNEGSKCKAQTHREPVGSHAHIPHTLHMSTRTHTQGRRRVDRGETRTKIFNVSTRIDTHTGVPSTHRCGRGRVMSYTQRRWDERRRVALEGANRLHTRTQTHVHTREHQHAHCVRVGRAEVRLQGLLGIVTHGNVAITGSW
jgi:hypothetical protein